MNRDICGFYHDPPLWVGDSPIEPGDLTPPNFADFAESMITGTLSDGIKFNVSRDGLFAFDFTSWAPGHFPPDLGPGVFEQTAELLLNQISVMNSFLVFLYTNELKIARFNRERMLITPELRIPLDAIEGTSNMGFGNQRVACLAMARFASTYRSDLPVSFDSRMVGRFPISTEIVEAALNDLSAVTGAAHPDGLALLDLFQRAGKAYQDHNHASAVITYWGVIERLLQEMWSEFQAANVQRDGSDFITGERRSRLNDGKTFTAAVITETLSFVSLLPLDVYAKLNKVRKVRNDWMHGTKTRVSGGEARTAAGACEEMLKLVRGVVVTGPQGLRLHG